MKYQFTREQLHKLLESVIYIYIEHIEYTQDNETENDATERAMSAAVRGAFDGMAEEPALIAAGMLLESERSFTPVE